MCVIFAPFLIVPSDERPYDIVGWEYIAKRAQLAKATIIRGACGVSKIPRVRRKPAGWFRRDVDAWLEAKADALHKPKQARPRLVRRKPAA